MLEQIAEIMYPFKDIIGTIAVVLTGLQVLSGVALCNEIRQRKSTSGLPVMPFLGGTVMSVLSLQYASMLQDSAMLKINFFGLAVNILYMTFFYWYTPNNEKMGIWAQIGAGGAVVGALFYYAQWEDPEVIETRFGIIITVGMVTWIASPLLDVGEIVRTKNSERLPFPMILSGTVVGCFWFMYGLCLNNVVIVLQNVLLLGLSVFQLSLCIMYPPPKAPSTKKTTPKKSKKTQ